jgi:N-glycosylase/DNA lyase
MRLKVKDFSLDKNLTAGQTFCWTHSNDAWFSFIDRPIKVKQIGDVLEYYGCSEIELRTRLGLNDDINSIKTELDKDDLIDRAINYSNGLRITKDGLWPATLSFILSIQSNILLIQRRILTLSKAYGNNIIFMGEELYSFPRYEEIVGKGIGFLNGMKLGFRTRFVMSAAEYFYNHELSERFNQEDIKKQLLSIVGIGDKVLDCILLYGLHDLSAFPMDVWMLRILAKYYDKILNKAKSYKDKRDTMVNYFGNYAGYAQLFLYNYARLNGLE